MGGVNHMKTSLLFLGILSTVFIASVYFNDPSDAEIRPAVAATLHQENHPVVWKLSISGNPGGCTASFVATADQLMPPQTSGPCAAYLPELQHLAMVRTNANGDITFYHEDGSKFAQFMESESSDHESFWPVRPLMTLARVR